MLAGLFVVPVPELLIIAPAATGGFQTVFIMIRPEKEEGQKIRDAAAKAGQSVQAFILDAVRMRMRDKT